MTFGWKALRLLARKSPHFFAQPPSGTGNIYKRVPDYLELVVSKMSKEMPLMTTGEIKHEPDDTAVTNANMDENIDNVKEDEDNDDPDNEKDVNGSCTPTATVSDEFLLNVATKLPNSEWKKLASKLKFQDDDIAYFESEHTTSIDQAAKMLTVWKDNEGVKASGSLLKQALLDIGQIELVSELFV